MDAVKKDTGKPGMHLLPSKPMQEIAKVMDFGAKKYDDHNWRKGMDWSRMYSALQRHLTDWNDNAGADPETGFSHLAHAGCCILFLLEYELKGIGNDDRYKGEGITFNLGSIVPGFNADGLTPERIEKIMQEFKNTVNDWHPSSSDIHFE